VLAFSGVSELWPYFVLAFLGGSALVFDAPNRHALTFQLVGREELPNAVALNSSLFNAGRIVGPAIGGVLIAAVGVGWCFAINAATFLAVLAGLLLMRPSELYKLEARSEARAGAAIRGGIRYARRTPEVWLVLAITAVVATTGSTACCCLCWRRRRCTERGGLGVLFASFGAGYAARRARRGCDVAPHGAPWCSAPRVQQRNAPARSRAQLGSRGRATARRRVLLLDLDGEQPVDPPADRARPPTRPRVSAASSPSLGR
jgi:MFS family permease